MKGIGIFIDVLSFVLAVYFLAYGVKAGIIERRILADLRGHYKTGRSAVVRGLFYIVIGCLFLLGAVFVGVALWMRN